MELKLLTFEKGLDQLVEFVNENRLKQKDIQLIVREGAGYKMLFWKKKVKSQE